MLWFASPIVADSEVLVFQQEHSQRQQMELQQSRCDMSEASLQNKQLILQTRRFADRESQVCSDFAE